MEENQNVNQQPTENEPNKVGQIILGFFVGVIIEAIYFSMFLNFYSEFMTVLLPILYLVLVVLCYSKDKKAIGTGLLVALLIPLLVFGGCLLVLMNY